MEFQSDASTSDYRKIKDLIAVENENQDPVSTLRPHQDFEPIKKSARCERKLEVCTVRATEPFFDGFTWRKYGQKDIFGAKYPRGYYRCTHRSTQGCGATKQVQREDEEPHTYVIVYKGTHTCQITRSNSEAFGRQPFMNVHADSVKFVPDEIEESSVFSSTTSLAESFQRESDDVLFGENDIRKEEGENETSSISYLRDSWPIHDPSVIINCNFQKLSSAFMDAEVKTIGIYGNKGIGKTTVMKAFFSHCHFKRLFDLVIWVDIPRCSPRRTIQNELAHKLSLNVADVNSDDDVAMILHQTLLARKFVLFFDNVQEHMDLSEVGIPIGNPDIDSKIFLATRSMHIFEAMQMDRIVEAEVLSKEESLKLFRFHVGHVMDFLDIKPYVPAVVDECSGLPLTIKVVGQALKMDSSILVWKHALKELLLTDNLQILKFGYNRLYEHDMRSCFLLSALFTESKAVKISSLVEYLVDEGLVARSFSDAHRRGYDIIKRLIDVSLLECSDDGLMVKMHDLLHDLALVILSEVKGLQMLLSRYFRSIESQETLLLSHPTFGQPESSEREKLSPSGGRISILKAGEGLCDPPPVKEWEEAKMVALMDNNLSSLPKKPDCSKLETLFLQRNYGLRAVPSSFFDSMSSLRTLNLSKTRIKSLPQSLSKLQYLQTLILRNCERLLCLPVATGALKRLLVLDVHGTEISHLPDQIGELLCLVHLQVCFYGSLDEDECAMLPSELMSKGLISNLSQLEELSITVFPGDPRWTKIASDVTIEVSNLKLHSLSFHFPEIKHLEHFINESSAWLHRTLTRFNFIVGHDVKRVVSHKFDELEHEQDQSLRFVNGEDIPDAIVKVLSKATAFCLDHHLTVQSLTQFGWASINGLKFCVVRDCPVLEAIIISSRNLIANCFPVLEVLSIHYSWNLSQIWVGPIQAGCLWMLRRLSVHACPKLEFILSCSMVAVLPNLEELIVVDCQSMKNIINNQDQISVGGNINNNDPIDLNVADYFPMQDDAEVAMELDPPYFKDLKIKVLKLHYLPNLVSIWNGGDLPCLEYASIYHCPKLKKLNLKSHVEVTMKEINVETDWWDDLEWDDPALPAKLQDRVKIIQSDNI